MGQQKGPFIYGIISFHIQRGIAFCKTQLLGQHQGLFEIQFLSNILVRIKLVDPFTMALME